MSLDMAKVSGDQMSLDTLAAKYAPTACRGILLSVGMSGSVIFGVAINLPALSPFAAFGAMVALRITPRHGASARIIGALAGCLFLLLAASLSEAVGGYPLIALLLLFVLSWLAALPKKDLSYLCFVTRCAALAVLLGYFDFKPSLGMGLYFCSGILLGILLSLANMAFEHENQESPLDELRAMLHGDINNPYLSLFIPATVVVSSLIAKIFSYSNPAWVGLTVIFIANSENTLELKQLTQRIVGTIAGTFLSYLILNCIHQPLQLALVAGTLSFVLPFAGRHYSLFCLLITCIVLVLIDIAMLSHGGDMRLLLWRCVDTIFGCLCVLAANILLKYVYWRKKRHQQKNAATGPIRPGG